MTRDELATQVNSSALGELATLLAEAYTSEVSTHGVLQNSGISTSQIISQVTAGERWLSLVNFLTSTGELQTLIDTVVSERPGLGASISRLKSLKTDNVSKQNNGLGAPETLTFGRPRTVPHFVGREKMLDDINDLLNNSPNEVPIIALVGLGGIGKTQCASRYCQTYAAQFGLILWLDASDHEVLREEFSRIPHKLGKHTAENTREISSFGRELLEGYHSRWLIVLDDVESPDDLRGLLPTTGHGAILITSRNQDLRSSVDDTFPVGALSDDDAVAHLLATSNSEDTEGARLLAYSLGGLPLALAHASAYVNKHRISFKDYIDALSMLPAREVLKDKPSLFYEGAIASTWRRSIDAAQAESPGAPDLLERLSFLRPTDIPRILIDRTPSDASMSVEDTHRRYAMVALASYSLIDLDEHTVSIHRMVQKVTREECILRGAEKGTLSALLQAFGASLGGEPSNTDATWTMTMRIYLHVVQVMQWVQLANGADDTNLQAAGAKLAELALRKAAQAAATSPVESVTSMGGPMDVLRSLRACGRSADLDDELGLVLRVCLDEVPEGPDSISAYRRILKRGSVSDIAVLLLCTVYGRKTEARLLPLVNNDRVRGLLKDHANWAACVRFACTIRNPDYSLLDVLQNGVDAGDQFSTVQWLRAVNQLPRREAEKRLRKYAKSHEKIAIALANNLEGQRRIPDAIKILHSLNELGPQVSFRLATLLRSQNRYEEYTSVLSAAAEKWPTPAGKYAKELIHSGNHRDAVSVLSRFSTIDGPISVQHAKLLLDAGDRGSAVAILSHTAHSHLDAALLLAKLHVSSSDYVEAAKSLKHHHRSTDPRFVKVARNLVLKAKRNPEQLASVYEYLKLEAPKRQTRQKKSRESMIPKDVLALAQEQFSSGMVEQAVLTLAPTQRWMHIPARTSSILTAAKHFKENGDQKSEELVLKYFAPGLPGVAIALAKLLVRTRKPDQALTVLESHIKYAETDSIFALQLSDIYAQCGRQASAISILREVSTPQVQVSMRIGQLLAAAGDLEEAFDELIPHCVDEHVRKRIEKLSYQYEATELALACMDKPQHILPSKSQSGTVLRQRLDRPSLTRTIEEADLEWYFGEQSKAIELVRPSAEGSYRASARLVEYQSALGRREDAYNYLTGAVPAQNNLIMLLVNLIAEEESFFEDALQILKRYSDSDQSAALGLSWLWTRHGDTNRALGAVSRYRHQEEFRSLPNHLSRAPSSSESAGIAATTLRSLGHLEYAHAILQPHVDDRSARLQLAELSRISLDFEACRTILSNDVRTYLPAAYSVAVSWLRSGQPENAAKVLADFSGKRTTEIDRVADYIATVRERSDHAIYVARKLASWNLERCAFEVLQVTQDSSRNISHLRNSYTLGVSAEEIAGIGRVRLRTLIRDQKLELVVWPDFRAFVRQTANARKRAAFYLSLKPQGELP